MATTAVSASCSPPASTEDAKVRIAPTRLPCALFVRRRWASSLRPRSGVASPGGSMRRCGDVQLADLGEPQGRKAGLARPVVIVTAQLVLDQHRWDGSPTRLATSTRKPSARSARSSLTSSTSDHPHIAVMFRGASGLACRSKRAQPQRRTLVGSRSVGDHEASSVSDRRILTFCGSTTTTQPRRLSSGWVLIRRRMRARMLSGSCATGQRTRIPAWLTRDASSRIKRRSSTLDPEVETRSQHVGSVTPDGCCPTQTANTGHPTTQLYTVIVSGSARWPVPHIACCTSRGGGAGMGDRAVSVVPTLFGSRPSGAGVS
jgi:hypothetical protein